MLKMLLLLIISLQAESIVCGGYVRPINMVTYSDSSIFVSSNTEYFDLTIEGEGFAEGLPLFERRELSTVYHIQQTKTITNYEVKIHGSGTIVVTITGE